MCWTQLLEPLQYQLARRLFRGRGVYGLCFLALQNAWVTRDKTHSPFANGQEALLKTQRQSVAAPLIIVKQRKWQVYSPGDNVLYFISKPQQSARQNRDYGLLEDVKNTSWFSCHKTPHDGVTLRNVQMDAFPHDNFFFKLISYFDNIFCMTAGLQRHCSARRWARGHPFHQSEASSCSHTANVALKKLIGLLECDCQKVLCNHLQSLASPFPNFLLALHQMDMWDDSKGFQEMFIFFSHPDSPDVTRMSVNRKEAGERGSGKGRERQTERPIYRIFPSVTPNQALQFWPH